MRKFNYSTLPKDLLTAETMKLISAVHEAKGRQSLYATARKDALLLSLMFVFDFTCIHPFNDGNGRISRLLTVLLLYKTGYTVGKYVSIEKEIERTKASYYNALAQSSGGWETRQNDPGPFVRYMLGVILAAYRELESRLDTVIGTKMTKAQRIEAFLRESIGKITKSQILEACPDISQTTAERTLHKLLEESKIEMVGNGRGSAYIWKR